MADPPAEEKALAASVTQSEWYAKARTQYLLARDGRAEGQCGYCGSCRADGLPPVLHYAACPRGQV